jgi:hypothetical protein
MGLSFLPGMKRAVMILPMNLASGVKYTAIDASDPDIHIPADATG